VNEAGQVHAYICDLRDLPYSEQLHWASCNEPPKDTISKRAFINDIKGEFVTFMHPREEIIGMMTRWDRSGVRWWTLRDEGLLHRANPPLTASRDEWANAFMDLSQLIAEGFEVKEIRKALQDKSITFDQKDQSIVLL
jgi:hypothetical protein